MLEHKGRTSSSEEDEDKVLSPMISVSSIANYSPRPCTSTPNNENESG